MTPLCLHPGKTFVYDTIADMASYALTSVPPAEALPDTRDVCPCCHGKASGARPATCHASSTAWPAGKGGVNIVGGSVDVAGKDCCHLWWKLVGGLVWGHTPRAPPSNMAGHDHSGAPSAVYQFHCCLSNASTLISPQIAVLDINMGLVQQAGVAMGLAKAVAVRFPEWGPDFVFLMVRHPCTRAVKAFSCSSCTKLGAVPQARCPHLLRGVCRCLSS